ncbi:DUF1775 domain-containing protein [Streptomyces sporangiiformans]|uniref:DUF1775 domain-containing protein n=1 Tax=Streptomyces sporangiiformans TaxID=2315329 RepID=A0A505DBM5_9ACTN|nr:DUF1775 domain-containing protein [Streptomyces sporangiiformans]TPQ19135.1 DUF1775 domain-containing protein [Streptomyces sporangiiformans]
MSRTNPAYAARRLGALTAVVLAAAVATAGPAAAHAEVEADGARALAQNVALTFSAESESDSAGISKLEVILPEGITPSDITYKEGPKGWKLAPTSRGYTVSGQKLPVGEDAEYVVTVRQLPDAKSLAFKTLQTYSDGKVDRWIELDEGGGDGHGHGHPAPRLKLDPAEPGAESVSPTPTEETTPSDEPTPQSPNQSPTPTTSAKASSDSTEEDDGMTLAVPLGIGASVLVLGGGTWWLKSRRDGSA